MEDDEYDLYELGDARTQTASASTAFQGGTRSEGPGGTTVIDISPPGTADADVVE